MSFLSTGTLVLSPTPLPADRRAELLERLGGDIQFAEVSNLKRYGILGTVRALRSAKREKVIVTGESSDLQLFQDLLRLAALIVPARSRHLETADGVAEPVGWRQVPRVLLRLAGASAAGFLALSKNFEYARRRVAFTTAHRIGQWPPSRCLYLRPTLMFGMPVGGSVGHVAGVVNEMRRRGIEVTVLAAGDQPMLDSEVKRISLPPLLGPAYPPELNSHRYHHQFYRRAADLIETLRPDFVYQRYTLNDLTGCKLRRAYQVPLLLEFNGSEVWVQRNWGRPIRFETASRRIEEMNLRSADLVVVVSETAGEQAVRGGASPDRVLFYPNGVDATVFDPARFPSDVRQRVRSRLGVPADADLFTFVGTFGKWHGTELLALAIRELVDRSADWLERHRLHFLFVGDGPGAPAVRETLQGRAAGAVTFAGYRPQHETPEILASSDVLLSPHVPNADGTPFLGSPTKLFEYMAMAKPIVASDLDQIGMVLRGWTPGNPRETAENAAILVRPGDRKSLVEGIRRAAELPDELRRELGERARRSVLAAFTWERNLDSVLDGLKRVLSGGTCPARFEKSA